MQTPNDLRFTKSHQWARFEGDVCTVGLTDFAVEQMKKEIVGIELPEPGFAARQDEACGIVDAVKASFDLYAPVGGEVLEINASVVDDPTLAAASPYGSGWLMKIRVKDTTEIDALLSAEEYRAWLDAVD